MLKPEPSPQALPPSVGPFWFFSPFWGGWTDESLLSARPCCSGRSLLDSTEKPVEVRERSVPRGPFDHLWEVLIFSSFTWSMRSWTGCLSWHGFFFSTSMDSEIGSTGPGKDGTVMNPTASPLVSFHWLWQWPWSTRQWRKQPDASSPPSRPHEYFHTKFPRVASWKGMIQENKIRRIDSPDIKTSQPEIFFWKEVWQVYMEISKWLGQIRTTNKNVPIQYIWPNHSISPT